MPVSSSGPQVSNLTHVNGGAVPAVNVTGRPLVDLTHWNGNELPAGAFSVRASSCQHVTASLAVGTSTSTTASISYVTTTRTVLAYGHGATNGAQSGSEHDATHVLTNATTITFNRINAGNAGGGGYASGVQELV